MSKNLDETVHLHSEKSDKWMRKIKGKKLQRIAEDMSNPPHLASSLAASFPARNKCPGTHCSLIEHEERKDSSCQKD